MPRKREGKSKSEQPPDPNMPRRPDRDRRVRQSERIARVLGVLNLIQSRGRWNAKAIADELECSERTVYRDLEVLEFIGVPWFFDENDQCYRVRADYQIPVLPFTASEVTGLAVAAVLSETPGLKVSDGVKSATQKLMARTKGKSAELIHDVASIVTAFDLKIADHSRHGEALQVVQHALIHHSKLTGQYASPYEDGPRKIVLHPYRLCLIKRAWYIVGRIDGENDAKTLRVARFKSLRQLDERADVPDTFDLSQHFGNAWSVYRGDTSYDITLKFDAEAAAIAAETNWHHTQRVTKHRDGSATFRFKVDGLNEIVRWIMTWSGDVEIVQPAALKELYVEKLEAALKRHSK